MKKSIFFLLTLLIINMISFTPDSNIIYASKSVLMGSVLGKSTYASTVTNIEKSRPRDYKIPDDESDSTSYTTDYQPLQIDLGNTQNVKINPWKGPKLVVLDPGHGGHDPGACANGLVEKEINLDVSLRINSILKKAGILVLMTRKTDLFMEPRERIDLANSSEAALFISIHSNWMKDTSLHGSMTLYYPSNRLHAGYLNEIDYALTVQKEFMSGIETKDRGIIDRPNLTVLKHANMPSVLVELGFISNPSDAAMMASDDFRQKAAEGIARGIVNSLSKID